MRRLDAVMKVRGGADQVNGSHLGEWKPPLGEAECIALLSIFVRPRLGSADRQARVTNIHSD